MGNEIVMIVVFTLIALAVGFAWVGGYLDAYQAKGQEKALDMMGENKASYGLKSTIQGQKVVDDKNVNELQDQVGNTAGGLFGKGGLGEGIGAGLSKGL